MSLLALLPLLVAAAHAGPVEAAEHRRMADEMTAAAGRSVWSSVDEQYRKLLELETRGEPLTVADHWLGAQAARALGDIAACRDRLDRAARAGGSKEVIAWLEELDTQYGRLRVTVEPGFTGDRALTPATPPFAPDQRAAVDLATRALAAGAFEGLVPLGAYTVGGQPVEVVAGDKVAALSIAAPREEVRASGPFRLAYAGPRASLGVAFTSVGGLTGTGRSEAAGLQASSFAGSGARLGLGLEVGFTPVVGVLAEVGYHNLFGPPTVDGEKLEDSDTYLVAGNALHLGYGWLAGSLRFGNLWLAAGPIWSAGGGAVTGVDGYCVGDDASVEQTAPCGESYPYLREDNAVYQRLSGKVTAGGGAASVSYGIVDIGKLRGAITLNGGLQTDRFRLYPWGQLAFTVAPASVRRGGAG